MPSCYKNEENMKNILQVRFKKKNGRQYQYLASPVQAYVSGSEGMKNGRGRKNKNKKRS